MIIWTLCSLLLLLLFLGKEVWVYGQHCPCKDSALESDLYPNDRNLNLSSIRSSPQLILCVNLPSTTLPWKTQAKTAIDHVQGDGFVIKVIDNKMSLDPRQCNIQMNVVGDDKGFHTMPRSLCPGACRPVPRIDLSYTLLLGPGASSLSNDTLLTCTMTGAMVADMYSLTTASSATLSQLLRAVFWRRLMECYERKFWSTRYTSTYSQPSSTVQKRPVFSFVMWIGSKAQNELIVEQSQVLMGQPFAGRDGVIGWGATDEAYPCRTAGIKCGYGRGHWFRRYLQTLPQSAVNYMPAGWACAQRRPLRALAHVLLLLDPQLVVLLDDDTLLNYDLLMAKYGHYLTQGAMARRPLVMGELGGTWGEFGHVTKWGMFSGGAGYIFGRRTIEALTSYEVKYYEFEGPGKKVGDVKYTDPWRSRSQVYALSVFREAWERSEEYCDVRLANGSVVTKQAAAGGGVVGANTCVLSSTPVLRTPHTSTHPPDTPDTPTHPMSSFFTNTSDFPSMVIPLGVRLIDLCTNLMSHENTCHHSDHAIGRCLVYGVFADPVNSGCHSTAPPGNPLRDPFDLADRQGVKVGLCFTAPVCNVSEQITCHRYKPKVTVTKGPPLPINPLNPLIQDRQKAIKVTIQPVKISLKPSHYKVFSSIFNGSFTDSHM